MKKRLRSVESCDPRSCDVSPRALLLYNYHAMMYFYFTFFNVDTTLRV